MMSLTPAMAGFLDSVAKDINDTVEEVEREMAGDQDTVDEESAEIFQADGEEIPKEPNVNDGSKPADEELWGHLWAEINAQWAQPFSPQDITVHYRDVTCDGTKEYIASRITNENPDAVTFVMVIAAWEGEEVRVEHLSIPFDGATEQFGLCKHEDPSAELFYDEWPQEEIDEFIGMKVCPSAVSVVDGVCDSPTFFWSSEAKGDEPHLVFFRH